MKKLGLFLLVCVAMCGVASAQNNPPDGPKPSLRQKYFSFSPPLDTANDTRPLTPRGKFELFVINTVSPYHILFAAATAGVNQANDTYPSWGQGAEGFGKRFGAAYADSATSNFFSYFLFPTVLHQDPRYFRKVNGSFGSRLGYALTRILVTRTDSGHSAPNASLWLGTIASGTLSNVYYPADQQTGAHTAERIGINFASTAGFNIAREFWPDVRHKHHHK